MGILQREFAATICCRIELLASRHQLFDGDVGATASARQLPSWGDKGFAKIKRKTGGGESATGGDYNPVKSRSVVVLENLVLVPIPVNPLVESLYAFDGEAEEGEENIVVKKLGGEKKVAVE